MDWTEPLLAAAELHPENPALVEKLLSYAGVGGAGLVGLVGGVGHDDADKDTDKDHPALAMAVALNHVRVARLLLNAGVPMSLRLVSYICCGGGGGGGHGYTDRAEMCDLLLQHVRRAEPAANRDPASHRDPSADRVDWWPTIRDLLYAGGVLGRPWLVETASVLVDWCPLVGTALAIQLNGLLVTACRFGNRPLVERLVQRGADLHHDHQRPLLMAIHRRHHTLVEYLLDQGADINARHGMPLVAAVQTNHWPTLIAALLYHHPHDHQHHDNHHHQPPSPHREEPEPEPEPYEPVTTLLSPRTHAATPTANTLWRARNVAQVAGYLRAERLLRSLYHSSTRLP